MRLHFFICLLLCVVVLFTAGCSRSLRFVSDVDSIALANQPVGKRYLLVPGNQNIAPDELEFLEYAKYVDTILTPLGFSKAPTEQEADLAILLSYSISTPQTHEVSESIPVNGQTSVASSTTMGTIMPLGGGMASYSGDTTYSPTYGITGYYTEVSSYTTYTRFIQVAAYDLLAYRNEKRQRQVWKTSARSTGGSNDLRLVLPYMLAAMRPYIARNTSRAIRIELEEDDPAARTLLGKPPSIEPTQ